MTDQGSGANRIGPRGRARAARRHAGTALSELAIFGMVALAALGFLLRVGMTMNYAQEVRMGAFRRCLAAAYEDDHTFNDAVGTTVHYVLNRRMPNPTDGFMTMPRTRTEASCFAEVGDRLTFAFMDDTGFGAGKPVVAVNSDGNARTFPYQDFRYQSGWLVNGAGTMNSGTGQQQQARATAVSSVGTSLHSTSGMASSTSLVNGGGVGSNIDSDRTIDWNW